MPRYTLTHAFSRSVTSFTCFMWLDGRGGGVEERRTFRECIRRKSRAQTRLWTIRHEPLHELSKGGGQIDLLLSSGWRSACGTESLGSTRRRRCLQTSRTLAVHRLQQQQGKL
ncbi:hypothetical protein MVEN_00679700 [Mycena venus]|uniref:Uncharacterized protein n=1 Tax=Mycena venus TaxID=2733690 RepID=A0A8H7D5I1_9AGAR|nr:hypothetical protein MVEN_00679700 [Mycena venus]